MNEFRLSGDLVATSDLGEGRFGVLIKTEEGSKMDFVWAGNPHELRRWSVGQTLNLRGMIVSVPVTMNTQKMYMLELRVSSVSVGKDSLAKTLKTGEQVETTLDVSTQDIVYKRDAPAPAKSSKATVAGGVNVKQAYEAAPMEMGDATMRLAAGQEDHTRKLSAEKETQAQKAIQGAPSKHTDATFVGETKLPPEVVEFLGEPRAFGDVKRGGKNVGERTEPDKDEVEKMASHGICFPPISEAMKNE